MPGSVDAMAWWEHWVDSPTAPVRANGQPNASESAGVMPRTLAGAPTADHNRGLITRERQRAAFVERFLAA